MTFEYNTEENLLVISFSGRLDTEKSNEIGSLVENKVLELSNTNPGLNVLFDIAKVNYIASAFIRICIKTVNVTSKDNFSLINSNPMIKKTFKIAGLDSELNVK